MDDHPGRVFADGDAAVADGRGGIFAGASAADHAAGAGAIFLSVAASAPGAASHANDDGDLRDFFQREKDGTVVLSEAMRAVPWIAARDEPPTEAIYVPQVASQQLIEYTR